MGTSVPLQLHVVLFPVPLAVPRGAKSVLMLTNAESSRLIPAAAPQSPRARLVTRTYFRRRFSANQQNLVQVTSLSWPRQVLLGCSRHI